MKNLNVSKSYIKFLQLKYKNKFHKNNEILIKKIFENFSIKNYQQWRVNEIPNLVLIKREAAREQSHQLKLKNWFQAATKNKHENSCTFRN